MNDMNWLDELLASVPGAKLSKSVPKAGAAVLHPREVLSKNIGHNIKLVDDPNLKIKGRKGMVKPEPMFEQHGDDVVITLKYARSKIKLKPSGEDCITVPGAELKFFLAKLKAGVEAKLFDDQLLAIKADRVAKQKATPRKKAA